MLLLNFLQGYTVLYNTYSVQVYSVECRALELVPFLFSGFNVASTEKFVNHAAQNYGSSVPRDLSNLRLNLIYIYILN